MSESPRKRKSEIDGKTPRSRSPRRIRPANREEIVRHCSMWVVEPCGGKVEGKPETRSQTLFVKQTKLDYAADRSEPHALFVIRDSVTFEQKANSRVGVITTPPRSTTEFVRTQRQVRVRSRSSQSTLSFSTDQKKFHLIV